MATHLRHSRADFSQLPAELIRAVYRDAGAPGSTLSLKDRVAALGVCKAWQTALKDLPLARLKLLENDRGLCKWALLTKPPVLTLEVFGGAAYPDLLPLLLHALPHKTLRELEWSWNSGSLTKALPYPALLSNLEQLHATELLPDTAWLGQLTGLRQLTQLRMWLDAAGGPTSSPLQLPSLPRLVSLGASLADAPGLQLDLHLGRLPSLEELFVYGSEGVLEVVPSSAPAGQLRYLYIEVEQLSLDFALLPALETSTLGNSLSEVQGAASIAACSSLSRLHLGANTYKLDTYLGFPWVAELLGNAPSSLRQLSVGGLWTAEAAAAVGPLAHLEGLSIGAWLREPLPLPPEDAAVWNNLRALDLLRGNHELSLPQAIRCATRLEAFRVDLEKPSFEDLDVLSSLPCLRKLAVEAPGSSEAAPIRRVLSRLMPQLLEVCVCLGTTPERIKPSDFFSWAFSG